MTAGGEPVIDVRGEMCPVPSLRVEAFLQADTTGEPFAVVGDHLPTLESLELLATRYGWQVSYEPDRGGCWRARFTRAS